MKALKALALFSGIVTTQMVYTTDRDFFEKFEEFRRNLEEAKVGEDQNSQAEEYLKRKI